MSVSFLIPVFRVELDWFKQAMSSVFRELDQTKAPGYEVVIVNDGTEQQDLIEYLAELEKDDRVVVVDSGKNLGVAGALNLGIEHCKNGLIARMDADDIILPGRLKKQIHYMNMNREVAALSTGLNYLMFYGGQWGVAEPPVIHPPTITKEIAKSSFWFMNHPTVMFRKNMLLDAGMYDDSLKGFSEDYELWIRMLRLGMRLDNLQESTLLLRINPNSATKSFNQANQEFLAKTQASL
jgi:glycosyltransferase involved in cell wall biosynthesis